MDYNWWMRPLPTSGLSRFQGLLSPGSLARSSGSWEGGVHHYYFIQHLHRAWCWPSTWRHSSGAGRGRALLPGAAIPAAERVRVRERGTEIQD